MNIDIPKNCAIIIPFYKGGDSAKQFLGDLHQSLPTNLRKQVFLVDDGSKEEGHFLEQYDFNLVRKSKNAGKASALLTGMKKAHSSEYTFAVTLDCDGQHSLESLSDFFSKIIELGAGYSGIIIGARSLSPKEMPFSRVLSNRITTSVLSKLAGQKLYDSQCGYRTYSLDLLESYLATQSQGFQWESEVLVRISWLKKPVYKINIQTIYGDEVSQISHWGDTLLFVKLWIRLLKEKLSQ